MKKFTIFLLLIMLMATSCDSLWEHKNEQGASISFTIPQEMIDSFVQENKVEQRALSGGISRAGSSVDTSILATVSIHEAETGSVLAEQSVNIGETVNDTITFEKLYIVGNTVYARVELTQYGYVKREKTSKLITVIQGYNELFFNFDPARLTDIESSIGLLLKGINGGFFVYQEGEPDEEVNAEVGNFYLGETEITQAQWETVMTTWPGIDIDLGYEIFPQKPVEKYGKSDNHPAYFVTWFDAIRFCNQLSINEGLEPVYYIGNSYPAAPNITKDTELLVAPNSDHNKNGYRLATEKEWEYAAGGGAGAIASGTRTSYAGTNILGELPNYAYYSDGSASVDKTGSVKEKRQNPLGLFDMSGNVSEWCWDEYKTLGDDKRSVRGGAFSNDNIYCDVRYRYYGDLTTRMQQFGFRVARSAP